MSTYIHVLLMQPSGPADTINGPELDDNTPVRHVMGAILREAAST